MNQLFRIIKYIIPYKSKAALSIFYILLSSVFSLFRLAMVAPFLNILFEKTKLVNQSVPFSLNPADMIHNFQYILSRLIIEEGKIYALIFVGVIVIVTSFLKNGFLYLSKFYMIPIRTGVVKDIRNNLYSKILSLPLKYFTEERKGDILARMSGDVQEIEVSVVRSLDMLFRSPILIIVYLASLFYISFNLTLFVIVLLPLSGFLIGKIGKTLRSTSLAGQKKLGVILSVIEETLGGLRIIKAFIAEKKMQSPLSEFLGVFVLVIVLWYGGSMVLGGNSTFSSSVLITYLVIFSQIINPAKAITTAYYNVLKGLASVERIEHIMESKVTITEKPDAKSVKSFSEKIEYRNVGFKYDEELVLENIDDKGKTIALVGRSGAGKSTFVDLLPRFIDTVKGQISIDGIAVEDYKIADLRGLMGIVSQQSILFNDTFFNNIAFGLSDATEEEVIAAAKVANAHDFIIDTSNGYYTNVGEGGSKMSGGQRQRINIARAVLKNPPILILDEATSALDTESERLVQEAIINLMKNRTSIVIAHRLSTVKYADMIVVLDDGMIVEKGCHNDLVKIEGGTYNKLHKLQMY
jgi:subfamily B ATP-binding cassette protein MsbA